MVKRFLRDLEGRRALRRIPSEARGVTIILYSFFFCTVARGVTIILYIY